MFAESGKIEDWKWLLLLLIPAALTISLQLVEIDYLIVSASANSTRHQPPRPPLSMLGTREVRPHRY